MNVHFDIVGQLELLISSKKYLQSQLLSFGDPAGVNSVLTYELNILQRFRTLRGRDMFKIVEILQSFLNDATVAYDSPSQEMSFTLMDVTENRLYIRSPDLSVICHYSFGSGRIIDWMQIYGIDAANRFGGMHMVGSQVFSFQECEV